MAEGARLESVYTATYRGFESPPHRHIYEKSPYASTGFFLCSTGPGDEKPRRGSTTGAARGTEWPQAMTPEGRAQRVNPPLTAILLKRARTKVRAFFFAAPDRGMRSPDRGSTTGAARGTEWPKAMTPAGRAQRVHPPLTAILLKRARTQVRAFFFAIPDRGMRSPDQITHVARPFSPCQTAIHQRHAS